MTEKEVIIELFKLKLKDSALGTHLLNGFFINGCSFKEDNKVNILGLAKEKRSIVFNNISIELSEDEFLELTVYSEVIKMEQLKEKEELRNKELIKDLDTLANIASKQNFNISRRVLTEKKINTTFKF